jgi:hypothetical protein
MSTTRKRTSGFTSDTDSEVLETLSVEEQEVLAEEVEEKEVLQAPELIAPKPFVEETIVPTPDLGPRFLEEVEKPKPKPAKELKLQPAPRRHPRNVPKFSRSR